MESRRKDEVETVEVECWATNAGIRFREGDMNISFNGKKGSRYETKVVSSKVLKNIAGLTITPGPDALNTYWVPYIGFEQPGMPMYYGRHRGKLVSKSQGWEEISIDSSRRKGPRRSFVLKYDKSGRLISLEKRYGDCTTYRAEFGDFVQQSTNFYYPKVITVIDAIGASEKQWFINTRTTYKAVVVDTKPIADDVFSVNRPALGTIVEDSRYIVDGKVLSYTYDNPKYTVDEMSKMKSKLLAGSSRSDSLTALILKIACYGLILYLVGRSLIAMVRRSHGK
jgi:hypothetical protein